MGMLGVGDMHHATVAIEELWGEVPGPKTPRQVAEKLRWFEIGGDVDVEIVSGAGERSSFAASRAEPDVARAALALEAATDHGLILPEAVRAA